MICPTDHPLLCRTPLPTQLRSKPLGLLVKWR